MAKQKVLIVIAAFVITLLAAAAVLYNMTLNNTMDTMEFIAGRYKGGTMFVDYDNSIGVDEVTDVGYWYKDNCWYVKYGKLLLEFTKKDLEDANMLSAIGQIGLDVRGNLEENNLRWYFAGEELEEWVPS